MIFHFLFLFSLLLSFTPLLSPRPLFISWLVEGKLVCLPLIFFHHSAIISPWPGHPSSAISLHHWVCLFVCVCWTLSCQAALYFPAWKHPRFPFNRPWKPLCSLSAVAEIPCSKNVCLVLCNKETKREKAAKGLPRFQLTVYCWWCIWRQPLTALQPFEPHIKGWQNGEHCVAVWLVKMSRHRLSLIWNSKNVCGNPLLLNIKLLHNKLFFDTAPTNWILVYGQSSALI